MSIELLDLQVHDSSWFIGEYGQFVYVALHTKAKKKIVYKYSAMTIHSQISDFINMFIISLLVRRSHSTLCSLH